MSLEKLRSAIASVREFVDGFESAAVEAEDAVSLVESFAELERLATAGRTLAGGV
ncbi:MAG: hypothetical protein ACRDKS_08260 [Actinomycetota bacterium]